MTLLSDRLQRFLMKFFIYAYYNQLVRKGRLVPKVGQVQLLKDH